MQPMEIDMNKCPRKMIERCGYCISMIILSIIHRSVDEIVYLPIDRARDALYASSSGETRGRSVLTCGRTIRDA